MNAFVGTPTPRPRCAYHNLYREPGVAHALDVEEGDVRVRLRLVQHPGGAAVGRANGEVFDDRHTHVRVRLKAKRQNRHADEEHGHDADDLRTKRERERETSRKDGGGNDVGEGRTQTRSLSGCNVSANEYRRFDAP